MRIKWQSTERAIFLLETDSEATDPPYHPPKIPAPNQPRLPTMEVGLPIERQELFTPLLGCTGRHHQPSEQRTGGNFSELMGQQ